MEHKSRPLLDLLLGIVIPSAILMNLSEPEKLGATGALILALAFPLGRGLYELLRFRVRNYIAVLGFVSVLLTGGIGLLQLDTQWLAIKEAAVPALLGIAVAISAWIGRPLVRVLLCAVANAFEFALQLVTVRLKLIASHLELTQMVDRMLVSLPRLRELFVSCLPLFFQVTIFFR